MFTEEELFEMWLMPLLAKREYRKFLESIKEEEVDTTKDTKTWFKKK